MKYSILLFVFALMLISGCVVQSPKYTTLKQVMTLKTGMTRYAVEDTLGVQPYDIKGFNDTSNTFIYVYRVIDRRTLSFNTKTINGSEIIGKYVQLEVTFSKDDKLISVESCNLCPDKLVTTSKLDFEKVMVFITITLPVLLVYFGLKQ